MCSGNPIVKWAIRTPLRDDPEQVPRRLRPSGVSICKSPRTYTHALPHLKQLQDSTISTIAMTLRPARQCLESVDAVDLALEKNGWSARSPIDGLIHRYIRVPPYRVVCSLEDRRAEVFSAEGVAIGMWRGEEYLMYLVRQINGGLEFEMYLESEGPQCVLNFTEIVRSLVDIAPEAFSRSGSWDVSIVRE